MGSVSKTDEEVNKVLKELREKYGCLESWRCGDPTDRTDYCGIIFVFPNGKREEANKAQHEIMCKLMEEYGCVSYECRVAVMCVEEKDLDVVMTCYDSYDRTKIDNCEERFPEGSYEWKAALVARANRVRVGRYKCRSEFELDKMFIRDGYNADEHAKVVGAPILFALFSSYVNWLSYDKTIPEDDFYLQENPGIDLYDTLAHVSRDDVGLASAVVAFYMMRKADLSMECGEHDWVFVPYMYNISKDALLRMCECFGEGAEEFKGYVSESYEKYMREIPTLAAGLPKLYSALISEEEVEY